MPLKPWRSEAHFPNPGSEAACVYQAGFPLGVRPLERGSGGVLPLQGVARHFYLPLGVIAIDLALAIIGTIGVRALRRISTEQAEFRRLRTQDDTKIVPTLLVGAGREGVMVAKEIAGRPHLG